MMKLMRHGVFSFIFLTMLVLAAFSLVLTDWTGSFRSGVGSHDIAKMEGDKIGQVEFSRLVERTLRAENIRPDQAFQMGLINQILTTELWQRMLARAAYGYGIAVDDATLLKKLQDLAAPIAAQEKTTPAEVIKRFIANQGMSEAAFLETMRRELGNNLLRQIMTGQTTPSPLMLAGLSAHAGQTRHIDYVVFHDDDVTGLAPPDEPALAAYYDRRKGEFMLPERRSFRLALLKREALATGVAVTDGDITAYYNEHKDSMTRPEMRRVQVATYKTKAEAERLVMTLKQGDDFLKVAAKTGTPARTDTQDFAIDATLPEVMAPVTEAQPGDILPPLETPFGWNVLRLDTITPAGTETLEQARKKIETLLRDEKINDAVDARLEELDHGHEQGVAFDAVVKAGHMAVTTFDNMARDGTSPEGADLLKDQPTIKASILTSAFSMTETGRVSPPMEFQNGDIGVLVMDAIMPAKPKELAELRDQLVKEWMAEERKRANVMALQSALPDLIAGTQKIGDVAHEKGRSLEKLKDVARDQPSLPSGLDRAAWNRLFDAEVGKVVFQPVPNGVMLAVVTSARLPVTTALDPKKTDEMKAETARAMAEEQVTQFLGTLNDRYKAKINDALIRRMYAPKATE